MGRRGIGLLLLAVSRSPDLYTWVMSACLNAWDSSPAARKALKIVVRDGAKTEAHLFSKRPGISSAPVALRESMFVKDFVPSPQIQEKTGTVDVAPVRVHSKYINQSINQSRRMHCC